LYPGPEEVAQRAFAPFHEPSIKEKAVAVVPSLNDIRTMSVQRDRVMLKGENMDCYNGLVKNLSSKTLIRTAERLVELVDAHGAAVGQCMTTMHPNHTDVLQRADAAGETGMCHRDRDFMVQTVAWNVKPEALEAAVQFGRDVLDITRAEDRAKGIPDAILAGNARVDVDMTTIYSPQKIEAIKEMKGQIDPYGVFWNPTADGWTI
jgi:hypothetical protein